MGDISTEPSMEEILSSIKRIIAEEGDGPAPVRSRRGSRTPSSPKADADEDEVLELRDTVDDDDGLTVARTKQPEQPRRAPRQDRPAEACDAPSARAEFEAILSERAAEASRGQLEALSRMIVKPTRPSGEAVSGSETLEGLVREMLRPMLSEWLDTHLPQIVEKMVAREIERITGHKG